MSAASPGDVVYYPGGNLHATNDFGATWTTVRPTPTWSRIEALEFLTPEHGWAIVLNKSCTDKPANACTYPILVSTDDGGRTWSVLSPQ